MDEKLLPEIREALIATKAKLRSDLTPEQKAEALRIDRIEFKSAGAKRRPANMCARHGVVNCKRC